MPTAPSQKKNKKKKKVAPAYFPQAFLVWKSVYDKTNSLNPSNLIAPGRGAGNVAKLQGAYIPEAVISKLFSSKKGISNKLSKHFLNLESHKISSLVPELLLYRIEEGREPKPFYFPTTSKYNLGPDGRSLNFEDSFSASSAVINSFSVTLAGKNPYEASRKFLTAKLDIKVDNISVLFQAPQGYANLADLFVIRTSGASSDAAGKSFSSADFQSSRNCRIGALLGYSVPRSDLFSQQETTLIESTRQLINLFYSGHELSLQQDGSATISISYTGFLEASNGSLSNLVSSPRSKAALQKKVSTSEKISTDIKTFFESEGQEEEKEQTGTDPFQVEASKDFAETPQERKKREEEEAAADDPETDHEDIIMAFREIVSFLYENGKIYSTKFSNDFFKKRYKTVADQKPGEAVESMLSSLDLAPGSPPDEIIKQDRIYYFNFGDFLQAYFYKVTQDLLEVSKYISGQANKFVNPETSSAYNPLSEQTLKDRDQAAKLMRDIKRFNILTANFSGMRNESKKHSPSFIKNIADVPISVDTLYSMVYEIVGKPQFRFYGMYEFLSDFSVKLLNRSFDKFQGADLIRDLTFKLTTFSARDLSSRITNGSVSIEEVPSPVEPFSKSSIDASAEYLLFHQESTQYNRSPGTGDLRKDTSEGIFHLRTSKDRGLLKTVTFSKIAMAQREAYLVARAGDLYDELRLPHNATAEMFGNNLFLPSSFVYIDPNSLGFGSIRDKNSAARRLGFGGYYTVESVSTTFSGGTLSTTLNLLFNAFPDTVGQPKLSTQNERKQLQSVNEVTNLIK